MKKIVVTGLVLSICLSTGLAHAQVMLDVSKVTCEQFVTYKVTNPKYLAVWLSGFHHGKSGDTTVDMQTLVANADKLVEYCLKHPDVPMMQAANTILEPQN
jgi:acid stress chaperone HdeB